MDAQLVEMFNALRTQIKEDNEHSLKQLEENITGKINKNIDEKFLMVDLEINKLKKIQEEQEKKIDYFDRKMRERNIILFGVLEEEKNYTELEEMVLKIINNTVKIECDKKEIEIIRRMGKKTEKPRPIKLTFTTYGKKITVLQQKKKLDGSGFYIKEDFPPKILEIRKSLIPQLIEQKQKGMKVMLKYDKLIVTDKHNNKRALSESPPKTLENNTQRGVSGRSNMSSQNSNGVQNYQINKKYRLDKNTITSYIKQSDKNIRETQSNNA